MPDFAMCTNKKCTIKKNCYRFKAKPNPIKQDYMFFEQDENGKCSGFRNRPGFVNNKNKEK